MDRRRKSEMKDRSRELSRNAPAHAPTEAVMTNRTRLPDYSALEKRRTRTFVLAASLTGCFLAGTWACSSASLKERTFRYQHQAGSVQVAVQSVAPFEEYIDDLQPRFSLSAQDALDQAIPLTRIEEIQELRSLSLNLRAALTKLKVDAAGTEARQPSDASTIALPGSSALPTPAPFTLPSYEALKLDPALRYHAAASLFQEVTLLSTYVRDAAVRKDTVPYVARLLVTVSPSSRTSPYDFYTTVSFFEPAKPASETLTVSFRLQRFAVAGVPGAGQITLAVPEIKRILEKDGCDGGPIYVIPLFATESYEASADAVAKASRTDLALAAGGSIGTVGAEAGAASSSTESDRALSRSINAPFSLTQLAGNTLQMRLGAVFAGPPVGFITPARQYYLTALVLGRRLGLGVEEVARAALESKLKEKGVLELTACNAVLYSASTMVRHARKGTPLKESGTLSEQVETRLKSVPTLTALPSVSGLALAVMEGDWNRFRSDCGLNCPDARGLWSQLQAEKANWGRSTGEFQLPDRYFKFFDKDAFSSLVDDGKSATLSILQNDAMVPTTGLSAILKLKSGLVVQSTGVKVGNGGRLATFSFPAVSALCKESERNDITGSISWRKPVFRWGSDGAIRPDPLDLKPNGCAGTSSPCAPLTLTWPSKEGKKPDDEKPKPGVTLSASRIVIRPPDAGVLTAAVRLARDEKKVPIAATLWVEGADIYAASGDGLKKSGALWQITSDTLATISLRNLMPGASVKVFVASIDAKTGRGDSDTAVSREALAFAGQVAVTDAKATP
jgi:hypothetical protein